MINETVSSLEKELIQVAEDINYKLDLCRKESNLLLFDRQFNRILATDYSNDLHKLNEAYIDIIIPKFENLKAMQTDIKVYTANESLLLGNENIFSIKEIKDNPLYNEIIHEKRNIAWLPVSTLARSIYSNYYVNFIDNDNIANRTGSDNNMTFEEILTLSRGVFDSNNDLLAVIDVYLPLSMIEKVLSNLKLPENGAGAYYDSSGRVITTFGPGKINEEDVSGILQDERYYGTIKGRDKILVFRKTQFNNGTIAVSYPMSYITGRISIIRNITHWTVIISILSVIVISYLLANLITRRLDKLMDKIKLIRDTGRTDVSIAIPGNDEIANIDRMFNIMISRVNDLTEKQLKAEVTRKVMEMEILQEQINPHFLYNSLSSIKWAINNPLKKDVDSVIDSLVRFYRLSLNKGREVVSVEEELQITREYTSIQKFTYDAAYDIVWDIDEAVYEYYCIKLILQPFVENAILHGLNQKKTGGCLKVGAYLENKSICFIVEDNGKGFDTGILKDESITGVKRTYAGFGIHNAVRRIKLSYGSKCSTDIKSTPGVGTRVVIDIPALTMDEINMALNHIS